MSEDQTGTGQISDTLICIRHTYIDLYIYSHALQYGCLEDVMRDVELLVSNAATFNEEDSTVYQVRSWEDMGRRWTKFEN